MKYLKPLILFVLTLPACFFLLKPGIYYNMHDDMQMIRQLEFEKCLKDGQIPCRWTPDLGFGYGYPLFNFYPPLPYIIGQSFRGLGLSFVNTIKLTAAVQIIAASLAMYLLASSLFGSSGGLLAALFYTYAPYHAVNIYIRGAMNEAWAAVFFPLIFYFCQKTIANRSPSYIIGLSLSFSGLLLSHNPMALTFTPFLCLWALFWLFHYRSKLVKSSVRLLIAAVFSLSLSAFFTLPVIFESKLVQINTMFQNYYHYTVHFTSLRQLFISSFWGEGPSVWGQDDQMSFMVGYLHWSLPLAIILFTLYYYLIKKRRSVKLVLASFIAAIGFFAAFLTHQRSIFIWQLVPIIQKIQFPWRFLNHTIFFLSLSVAVLPRLLPSLVKNLTALGLIICLLLILNLKYFRPLTYGPLTDGQKFSGLAWQNQITSGIYDYLPKTAATAPKSAAKNYIDQIDPTQAQYQLFGQKKGTDWLFFNIILSQDSRLTLPLLYFPRFQVYDNYQLISHQIDPHLGRIVVNLTAGSHQLFVKLHNTPIRTISNLISLFAWAFLFIRGLKKLWHRFPFKI